ncbi:gas vesicle protein GvpN [Trichothermofontia sp.]
MTTILQARSRGFVTTPSIERLVTRALRYLQSGFSVHLRGPAGTGKTTLAMHLADLLGRPIMLVFGDDEFKTSDLIGNQSGYTRKKVVDNYIHSVVKLEDELRQTWVDARLTLACREGFTLVYDEFNRSRPEVNNVLLSALEEKLLVLPPTAQRSEYVRVNPHFRGIFTSNPEEYCGVHGTQDALMDRLVTISVPEPDELTQQEILVQKVGLDRPGAATIVQLVKAFRTQAKVEKSSGLRSCLMIAKVCHEHHIPVTPLSADFRDVCGDILLSRTALAFEDATTLLWQFLNELAVQETGPVRVSGRSPELEAPQEPGLALVHMEGEEEDLAEGLKEDLGGVGGKTLTAPLAADLEPAAPEPAAIMKPPAKGKGTSPATKGAAAIPAVLEPIAGTEGVTLDGAIAPTVTEPEAAPETAPEADLEITPEVEPAAVPDYPQAVYDYLIQQREARLTDIEKALKLSRVQVVDAIRTLLETDLILKHRDGSETREGGKTRYRVNVAPEDAET